MKITVRAEERAAVVAALEREYASDREAADEIFRTVHGLICARDSFGIEFLGFPFGPWYHGSVVKRLAASLPGATVHKLWSSARFTELQDADTHRRQTSCAICDHPLFAHGFSGARGCVVRKCRCKEVAK